MRAVRQFDSAFGGVAETAFFLFLLAVVFCGAAVLVRIRKLEFSSALRLSVVDAALVFSVLLVVHLVCVPQPDVSLNRLRLMPGTDLGVAVHAEPGDLRPWLQLLGNLLLLLPLGALLPMRIVPLGTCLRVVLAVFAVTCAIELFQYSLLTGRVVSADDVVLNTAGGLIGAILTRKWWSDFRRPPRFRTVLPAQHASALRALINRFPRYRFVIGDQPVTRAAASFPEISTGGTPTPGVVPDPARTAFSSPRTRFPGRNGPVWANVCAAENGVPAAWPCAAQSAGVTSRRSSTDSEKPVKPRRSRTAASSSA